MVIIIIVIKLIDTNPLNLGTYRQVAKVLPYACLSCFFLFLCTAKKPTMKLLRRMEWKEGETYHTFQVIAMAAKK